jgi:hypothetical protein
VADELPLFCCGRRREVGDPCIDPPNGIRNICTVYRNLVTDEKIFLNISLNPLTIVLLLFNRPSTIAHAPDLKRRFFYRLAKGRG